MAPAGGSNLLPLLLLKLKLTLLLLALAPPPGCIAATAAAEAASCGVELFTAAKKLLLMKLCDEDEVVLCGPLVPWRFIDSFQRTISESDSFSSPAQL